MLTPMQKQAFSCRISEKLKSCWFKMAKKNKIVIFCIIYGVTSEAASMENLHFESQLG